MTEFIKVNFQPRSVFVGMTVKNIDPGNVTHHFNLTRVVLPALDGSAANDQYNQFGVGAMLGPTQFGRTGQASQVPGPGTNSLVMGPTQLNGVAVTSDVPAYQGGANPCFGSSTVGPVTGGNRVLVGTLADPVAGNATIHAPGPNASVNAGKYVYRML